MSNYLAIATVTAVLNQLLQQAVQIVPGSEVSIAPPQGIQQREHFQGANLYLYRVAPNRAFEASDLAAEVFDDVPPPNKPNVALDLYYLISFYGHESQLEPQRMMGNTISILKSQSILTAEKIQETISLVGTDSYLLSSNLAQQIQTIKLSLLDLNLKKLSKLWSIFSTEAHSLSIAYRASVVMLDEPTSDDGTISDDETVFDSDGVPKEDKIEAKMLAYVEPEPQIPTPIVPSKPPYIETIIPTLIPFSHHAKIRLCGEGLVAEGVKVCFNAKDDLIVEPQVEASQDLQVILPNGLQPGQHTVQVFYTIDNDTNDSSELKLASNLVSFILQPNIMSDISFATVSNPRQTNVTKKINTIILQAGPEIGLRQQVKLLLNQKNPTVVPPRSYALFSLLRFGILLAFEKTLDAGKISKDLQLTFKEQDILLSEDSTVKVEKVGHIWLVNDVENGQLYSIRKNEGCLMVYFGLIGDDLNHAIAFQVQVPGQAETSSIDPGIYIESGTYLVRLEVDQIQYAESPLTFDPLTKKYTGPTVVIPEGTA